MDGVEFVTIQGNFNCILFLKQAMPRFGGYGFFAVGIGCDLAKVGVYSEEDANRLISQIDFAVDQIATFRRESVVELPVEAPPQVVTAPTEVMEPPAVAEAPLVVELPSVVAPPPVAAPEIVALPGHFGAIATGNPPHPVRKAVCTDLPTQAEADACAIERCGWTCEVRVSFGSGQCGAFAEATASGLGFGIGPTLGAAIEDAKAECRRGANRTQCVLLIANYNP